MVGPDEWLPDRVVARVIPNTTPPQGVPGNRWIEVNLYEQTLAVYDQGELVFCYADRQRPGTVLDTSVYSRSIKS